MYVDNDTMDNAVRKKNVIKSISICKYENKQY